MKERSIATAVLGLEMAAGLHRRDDFQTFALLLAPVFGVFAILRDSRIDILSVERLHEPGVVDTADVMQVPQLHGIYFTGIGIISLGLLIDVRDGGRARVESRFE